MSTFDPERFKQQERAGFNLIADRYERACSTLAPVQARMLQLAQLSANQQMLDVASGPGLLARAAARSTRGVRVVAFDLAEEALAVGRERAVAEGLSDIDFQKGDAEQMPFADASFDCVLCGLGLMHFPDAAAATREMFRVLKPGGRFVASVWGERSDVPFLSCALAAIERNLPPPKVERPSMFRFGNPEVLKRMLQECGFTAIDVERVPITPAPTDTASYWQGFLDLAGVTTVALAKLPQETQDLLATDVARDLAPYSRTGVFRLDSVVLIAAARKPM
jgi:ubiquinone/menaquinone biosynthesis C-methylase UbiE